MSSRSPQEQPLQDEADERTVVRRRLRYRGAKWDVVTDEVLLDPETPVERDVVQHPGAVGVLPMDDVGQVLLIQQYRHPVGRRLWEIPAGLLDIPGEALVDCARRELFEEAHLTAERYDVLLDLVSSPGMSSEGYRIFLARGLTPVPEGEQHEREHEERDMVVRWVPLPDAIEAVLTGRIGNAMAVAALLAAAAAESGGWQSLRPVSTPWQQPGARLGPDPVESGAAR